MLSFLDHNILRNSSYILPNRVYNLYIYLNKDNSKSLSLDLYGQFDAMLKTNQFRFTPPTVSFLGQILFINVSNYCHFQKF